MAAIVLHEGQAFDSEAMSVLIVRDLASYARPIFLRILQELPLTGTFKLQKGDLREAAYHPDKCSDTVYVLKPGRDRYEMLDEVYYEQIISGQAGY
jgi:acyl-CoA synthetase (AMP-forming)/AMP-acid ligase II